METAIVYWGCIGIMEDKMETPISYRFQWYYRNSEEVNGKEPTSGKKDSLPKT